MSSRNEIEELKARKKELERQIEVLEKEAEMPKVYDPSTGRSYPDPWGEQNRSYMVPNIKSGIGYKTVKVYTACKGSPESQGYISVWKCNHQAARHWCINNIKSEMRYHEERTAALLRRLELYTERMTD